MDNITGTRYTITHCSGALASLEECSKEESQGNFELYKRQTIRMIERLADGHPMTSHTFPSEGLLPDGNKFNAIKKQPLRAYLWRSKKYKNTYFISHYIIKTKDKLAAADTKRVCENWAKKEDN